MADEWVKTIKIYEDKICNDDQGIAAYLERGLEMSKPPKLVKTLVTAIRESSARLDLGAERLDLGAERLDLETEISLADLLSAYRGDFSKINMNRAKALTFLIGSLLLTFKIVVKCREEVDYVLKGMLMIEDEGVSVMWKLADDTATDVVELAALPPQIEKFKLALSNFIATIVFNLMAYEGPGPGDKLN